MIIVAKACVRPKRLKIRKPPARIYFSRETWPGKVALRIDGLQLVSELNAREHHMAKHRRKKSQQRIVSDAMIGIDVRYWVAFPMRVTIVRIGPKALDRGDNLESCGKHVRDQVARSLRIDDGSDAVEWRVEQRPIGVRKYAVEVVIETLKGQANG